MEERKKLADQIWFTRVSRARAEQRLINKENFIQFINIYYSLFAIICSILSLLYDDKKMSLFTVIITIGLMISILFLNGQKYLERASDYKKNHTQLQLIEMELLNSAVNVNMSDIQKRYCELLNVSSNHIEYDYLVALKNADEDYKTKKNWRNKQKRLFWERFWRIGIKLVVVVAPILILIACEVWAK